jgi:hypothetical protein
LMTGRRALNPSAKYLKTMSIAGRYAEFTEKNMPG